MNRDMRIRFCRFDELSDDDRLLLDRLTLDRRIYPRSLFREWLLQTTQKRLFAAVLFRSGVIVGWAAANAIEREEITIGVFVSSDYRGKHYADNLVHALMRGLVNRGECDGKFVQYQEGHERLFLPAIVRYGATDAALSRQSRLYHRRRLW